MRKFNKVLGMVGMAALALVVADPAFAAPSVAGTDSGLGVITGTLKSTATNVTDILSLVSYVAGVAFGIKAILKFKEHNETKGQVPISQPIVLFVVTALLLSLPSILRLTQEATVGTGTSNVSITDGGLRALE
jgi:MFS-type transporter involved in bile tolerance (Atg22 family)